MSIDWLPWNPCRRRYSQLNLRGDTNACTPTVLNSIPTLLIHSFRVALWEFMGRFTHPLCSHLPHSTSPTPICSVFSIIDFDKVSFKSLWSLRGHLQEASGLATANYPETLHTIAVVNAPSFFPTVWGWIKVGHGPLPRLIPHNSSCWFPTELV